MTQNRVKALLAERATKIIKSIIARFITHKLSHQWVEALPKLTASYNKTYRRSIKRTPASVKPSDNVEIWKKNYMSQNFKRISLVPNHSSSRWETLSE